MRYYDQGDIIVRDAVLSDVIYIAEGLRQVDKDEIWASNHLRPWIAVILSFRLSQLKLTVVKCGIPVAMFGVHDHVIWLLGTERFSEVSYVLARRAAEFIRLFLTLYEELENYVDIRNKAALRLLHHCGAVIDAAVPFGAEGRPFHHFIFRRTECAVH